MIENKKSLADQYESTLTEKDKINIEKYVNDIFEDELGYIYSFPRMIFMNGYYYAKVINMKLPNMDEYIEKPFLKMAKTKIDFEGKKITELDRFILSPKKEEMVVRDCFIAGMEAFNDMLDELRLDDFFGSEGELDPRGDNRD